METFYTVGRKRKKNKIKRLGTDGGSDYEHLFAKFRLKLNKVELITRPFRYDLNQIPMVIQ